MAKNRFYNFLTFTILFLGVCFYYNIHQTISYAPTSVHNWRQADCASIALNYYQDGMEFSNQQFHIQGVDKGRKLTECPILYYFIAILYHVFGPQDWVFRGVNLFILFIGLYSLSRITFLLLNDLLISITLPLLIFSSPLLAYYGSNFLPNAPAFGFAMTGSLFILKYITLKKTKNFYLGIIFFTLAGLIKLTAVIPLIAIFILFLFELFGLQPKNQNKIFTNKNNILIGFCIFFILVLGWALGTNDRGPLIPIWELEGDFINKTFTFIREVSLPSMFSPVLNYTVLILGLITLFLPKKLGYRIYLFNLLILFGVIIVFFMIFKPLFIHDYYFIEFIILPLTIILTVFHLIKNQYPFIFTKPVFKLSWVLVLLLNIGYAKSELNKKYDFQGKEYGTYSPVQVNAKEIRLFLKENGIAYPDAVISAPDWSPNATLYIMNLIGWSEFSSPYTPIQPKKIENLGKCCAKYLIIQDKKYLEREDLKQFFKYPIANYKNTIFVFDLEFLKEK